MAEDKLEERKNNKEPKESKKQSTGKAPTHSLAEFERILPYLNLPLSSVLGPLGSATTLSSLSTEEILGTLSTPYRDPKLEKEITDLKRKLNEQQQDLEDRAKRGAALEETIQTLKETLRDLQTKETLNFILHRIHERARETFLDSAEFQEEFLGSKRCSAYVMSVDLRRSTELMLKSKRPEFFAQFITDLGNKLRLIILESHGVFDKFTGDGILAFFPDFYTGPDAGFYAVRAADQCHRMFLEHYRSHYNSFHTVLKNVGLGVGIDFGDIHLVRVVQELAIVGTPVVYACRMAGVDAGKTLLNQPAYQQIFEKFSAYCSFDDSELDVKHEGIHLGHLVGLNGKQYDPAQPGWFKYVKETPPSS